MALLAIGATVLTVTAGASGPDYYRLVQEPSAGFGFLGGQIRSAQRSITIEMYELSDTAVEHDLAAAAARGVDVRVLLDSDDSGSSVNAAADAYLSGHRVHVRWAPSDTIFHIKTIVFDARTADVSSANLTPRYYADTRDATITDTNPAQVRAITATFNADWNGGDPASDTTQAPGVVWSPRTGSETAETVMIDQIKAATHSIRFESEELSDSWVYDALAAAAGRGVSCEVVMTADVSWDRAFATLTKAGCHVHTFPDAGSVLYIHEKLLLTDAGSSDETLLLGSQNGSYASLAYNRELSLQLHAADGGGAVISVINATFNQDYAHSSAW